MRTQGKVHLQKTPFPTFQTGSTSQLITYLENSLFYFSPPRKAYGKHYMTAMAELVSRKACHNLSSCAIGNFLKRIVKKQNSQRNWQCDAPVIEACLSLAYQRDIIKDIWSKEGQNIAHQFVVLATSDQSTIPDILRYIDNYLPSYVLNQPERQKPYATPLGLALRVRSVQVSTVIAKHLLHKGYYVRCLRSALAENLYIISVMRANVARIIKNVQESGTHDISYLKRLWHDLDDLERNGNKTSKQNPGIYDINIAQEVPSQLDDTHQGAVSAYHEKKHYEAAQALLQLKDINRKYRG